MYIKILLLSKDMLHFFQQYPVRTGALHFVLMFLFLAGAQLGFSSVALAADEGAFSDNVVEYRFGANFKEPTVAHGQTIEKHIVNFNHFNEDSFGSNFVSIDALFSDGADHAKDSTSGAREVYTVLRRDWSGRRVFGIDVPENSLLNDIALHMGGDLNTKNNALEPMKRLIVIGPELQFALLDGHFNIAFDYAHEWNHNGIVGKYINFDPAFEMEASWRFPFSVYGTFWHFSGFANYVGPKGVNAVGAPTRPEIFTRPQILLDAGPLFDGAKDRFEIGGGLEYALNRSGVDHRFNPGAKEIVPELIAKLHF